MATGCISNPKDVRLEFCGPEKEKNHDFKIFQGKNAIYIYIYTPSCKKVVIEGKNISSLVRREYD